MESYLLKPVVNEQEVLWLRQQVSKINITDEIYKYAVDLVDRTRKSEAVKVGGSPRATIAICKIAQALALFRGCEYVKPDFIQEMIVPVMAHRLILSAESKISDKTSEEILNRLVKLVKVPVSP